MNNEQASMAGRALTARRWAGHVPQKTQPRRMKIETIKRVKQYGKTWGLKFDETVQRLLDQADKYNGLNEVSE